MDRWTGTDRLWTAAPRCDHALLDVSLRNPIPTIFAHYQINVSPCSDHAQNVCHRTFTSTLSNNICARYILIKLMLPFGHVSGTSFMCLGFERIKAEPV